MLGFTRVNGRHGPHRRHGHPGTRECPLSPARPCGPYLLFNVAVAFLFFSGFSLTDEAEEKAEFVEGLKRDIIKVDHSIDVTKDLIKKSKNAPYLPDIVFRLAELYVEKSRLIYYLDVETKGAEQALASPEAKLWKNEAIQTYRDVMHNFPDYRYNDKVLFFLAHEYHELGMHEEMLSSYKKLTEDYPKSSLLLESLFIVGDYYFNRDDLKEAEKWYNEILKYRESPMHDMARYKLGWIAINKAKEDKKFWKEALQLFEQVATSTNSPDEGLSVDTHKMVNIKLEAINGIVFCYTEVFSAKEALEYFRKLAPSKQVYIHALEKLANRYFIKEQYDNAAIMYRKIVDLSSDVEKNLEYAQRVYDAASLAKNKERVDEDVAALAKAASLYTYSWRIPDQEKKQLEKEFEVYARDIVTKLHMLAQQRKEKHAFRIAARAYKNYLSFFDYSEKIMEVRYNYAESLFNSQQYLDAGRAYEEVARTMSESKERKEALYSSIQAYQAALGEAKYLNTFGLVEARQALKQLGGYYVRKYPKDEHVPTIKFNVARMFYEQGEYQKAIESFLEYIKQYPTHSEVAVAGHLVLDCYKQLEDYRGLAKQGRAFVSDGNIRDQKFKQEVAAIVEAAEGREIDKKTLEVSKEGKDAALALLDYASEVDKTQAENVIYRSFVMAKEKRDIELAFRAGGQMAKQYPKSQYLVDVYATLGNFSAQIVDFDRAAALYEDFFQKFPDKPEARQAMSAAAKFHVYLGEYGQAIKDLRQLLEGARGDERGQILEDIAEAYAQMNDWGMVLTQAREAVSVLPSSVKGQLLLARALEKKGKLEEAKQAYLAAAGMGGGEAEMAAEAQFRLGEMIMKEYQAVRFGAGDQDQVVLQKRLQFLQMLEQIYGGVVQMKSPEWAIASLFRLHQAYEDFAAFLAGAPVPPDLNAEQKKQYQQMLAEQVKAQQNSAQTYLDACRKTVRDKKIFGPYAMACLSKQEPTERVVRSRTAAQLQGPKVEELRKKLLKSPNDMASLDEMAREAMRVNDFHLARLVLSKALEINENHADSLNLMGVIELSDNNDMDAYAYFKKAMDNDGRHLPARLNLAAMFVRYEDEARGRAVLEPVLTQVRTADLSLNDIHPLARDALAHLKVR